MGRTRALTPEQIQGRKDKAVSFTRDVVGDPDRAAEIEAEDLEDYAERRKLKLNPGKAETTTQETIAQAAAILKLVYRPSATRLDLARAVGEALDLLEGGDDGDQAA